MKRILTISSLAVAFGLTVPALAGAQDTVRAGGEVARTPSYATLMSALAATERATQQIKALTTVNEADVRIVDIKDFVTDTSQTELNEALTRHQAELDSLHAAIEANATLSKAVASHKTAAAVVTDSTAAAMVGTLTAKDVVAAEVTDSGEVVLYVRRTK